MATKKGKALARQPVIYPDSVRPPPVLPDAATVLKLGWRLSGEELMVIRMAMAIHSAARQPKLTWTGWRHLALATLIGAEQAKKAARGRDDTPDYRQVMSQFLRATGFVFLNKNDRAAAVRLLPRWDEIDAWRSSLPKSRQQALNNPREVWDAYLDHRRKLGDPEARPRPASRRPRQFPSALEQMQALAEQLEMVEERAERAESERDYFVTLMLEIAKRAKLSQAEVDEIRAKVKAEHQAAGVAQPEEGDA